MSGKVLWSLFDPWSPTMVLQEEKANASAGAPSHTHLQTFQMKTELRVLLEASNITVSCEAIHMVRWERGNKVVISSLPVFYGPSCGQVLHCSHWESPSLIGNMSQPERREGDSKMKGPRETRGREKGMRLRWTINLKTFVFSAASSTNLCYKIHVDSSFLNTNTLALFG